MPVCTVASYVCPDWCCGAQAEVDRLRQRDEQQHSELAQSVLTLQGQLEQEKGMLSEPYLESTCPSALIIEESGWLQHLLIVPTLIRL